MSTLSDYERGRAEGRVNALLEEHTQRLNKINGSVERHAQSVEDLTLEIRQMREEARIREERVKVAAETLAAETERRRVLLADEVESSQSRWDLRASKATVIYGLVTIASVLSAIYEATR